MATKRKKLTKKKKRIRKIKRILFLIVILVVIVLLARCAIKKFRDDPKDTEPTESTTDIGTVVTTEEITTEAEVTTAQQGEVTDENGNKITDIYLDERLIRSLSGIQERLKCKTVFVYDRVTKTYVLEINTRDIIHPASITKLWTSLYALSELEPDTKITAGDEVKLIKPGSSTAYIKSGKHTLKLSMLVEGMLLPSGNDAAYVVAAAVGKKLAKNEEISPEEAISYFMIGLNEYVELIGCKGTVFSEPDGNTYENHYTTVPDLVLVADLALQNGMMREYMATQKEKVYYASGQNMTWTNTNLLLDEESDYYTPYAVGMKTGSLEDEYSLLAAAAVPEGSDARFIIGCFAGQLKNDRFADAKLIIDTIAETVGK